MAPTPDKNWVTKPQPERTISEELANALGISHVLAELLVQRGIEDEETARDFFRPRMDQLLDPFLMKDMDKAIEKINETIIANKPILIFGDYDVDGTTAVALLYSFLSNYYNKLGYYIPDRYREGYGLSPLAIDYAKEHGYELIITLDCGITANQEVKYAASLGIEVIISDHHLPTDEIPEAVAILNPKQKDCPYPFKHLSGCGIGFKLAQAFCMVNNMDQRKLNGLIDLVAVSIASDIVPIIGENRTLAYFGLKKLNANPMLGLKVLADLFVKNQEVTISDIVFYIGPRINAAGRLGDARDAVKLLLSTEKAHAEYGATQINNTNLERRDLDSSITEEAISWLVRDADILSKKTTVLYNETWHKGVIGIVASRLIEKFYRPTIVFTRTDDMLTGSARSVKDFNIYQAIAECSEYVEQFGGHKYAAGLTIREEHFESFREKFDEVVSKSITDDMLIPKIEVDAVIGLNELNHRFVRTLKQFAPFGPGNMEPVFCSEDVVVTGNMRIVGSNHLQLFVKQENTNSFAAIGFNLGQHFDYLSKGLPFKLVYTVEENVWKGKSSIKLTIKDIKY